jgi:hypothetical protein
VGPTSFGGVKISVSPDGTPWVLDSSGHPWMWNGTSWIEEPDLGRDVAAGPNGTAWSIGVDQVGCCDYGAWYWNGSTWSRIGPSGSGALHIARPPDTNDALVINSAQDIYQWNGTAWEPGPAATATSIAGGPDSAIWITGTTLVDGSNYDIEYWDGSTWQEVSLAGPAGAVQISVDPDDGLPWIREADGTCYKMQP